MVCPVESGPVRTETITGTAAARLSGSKTTRGAHLLGDGCYQEALIPAAAGSENGRRVFSTVSRRSLAEAFEQQGDV
jgi:hypothetical protein